MRKKRLRTSGLVVGSLMKLPLKHIQRFSDA